MPGFAKPDDENAFSVLWYKSLGIQYAIVDVITQGLCQCVIDDLKGFAFVIAFQILHIFEYKSRGLVVFNNVGYFEEQVALLFIVKSVFFSQA